MTQLEAELVEERQRARGTERRLRAHVASLLDQRDAGADEPAAAAAFALPPSGHPFWREPEAPGIALRMVEDGEAARARCAARLEAALEARRALGAQLDALQAKHRALQSTALSLELAGAPRRV